jgi:hypothetical protein
VFFAELPMWLRKIPVKARMIVSLEVSVFDLVLMENSEHFLLH